MQIIENKFFGSNKNQNWNSCLKELNWYVVLTQIIFLWNKLARISASSNQKAARSEQRGQRFNRNKVIELFSLLLGKVKVISFVVCFWPVALSFEMFCSICLVVSKQQQRQADCLYFKYWFICLLILVLFLRNLNLTFLVISISPVCVST